MQTSNGGRPDSAASSAIVLPTWPASSGRETLLISIVSHSATTPWQPSEPVTSRCSRMRARSPGSRRRAIVSSALPEDDQLGRIAESVVAPGR